MKIKILILLFLIIFTIGCKKPKNDKSISEDNKKLIKNNSEETGNSLTFSWELNGEYLNIKISAPTNGWIAVGFDPSVKMKEADFIIGSIKDGTVNIEDHYGTGAISHKKDIDLGGKNNITNISGNEKNGYTELSFTIPVNSGDKYDKILGKGEHIVLLAYSNSDSFAKKHIKKEKRKITL